MIQTPCEHEAQKLIEHKVEITRQRNFYPSVFEVDSIRAYRHFEEK